MNYQQRERIMKSKLSMALVPLLLPAVGFGLTLEEAVQHVTKTNPQIVERVKNFNKTAQDIDMAKAGYLPSVDIELKYGDEHTDNISHPKPNDVSLKRYERGIKASINLFEGFATYANVNQQEARTEAAKNSVLEKANALGLETVEAYLELMKQHAFLKIAEENLKTHKAIHERINERTESGFGSKSEQDQSKGRLSLAESNVIIQTSNFRDALAKFTRLYGEKIDADALVKPTFEYTLPESLEAAVELAKKNHPAIQVQHANIVAAEENAFGADSAYYPRLDAEIAKYHNDNIGGDEGHYDTDSAMLILSYNLFAGGYYQANREKQQINALQERAVLDDLNRAAAENVTYAWIAYEELNRQIPYLKAHRDYSITTLDAYNQEFSLGRRTLLDILNTENERTTAEQELVRAEYDLLLAKYRILNGTGSLAAELNAAPALQ